MNIATKLLTRVLFLTILPVTSAVLPFQSVTAQEKLQTVHIHSAEDLHEFFRYTGNDIPLVSGHRGGIVEGYPENSIAALENTLGYTHAFFEVDPRITQDNIIVLMHDETLDRTTNGTGNVSDYTWEELQEFRLVDHLGNETENRIPSLAEVIEWSRGKTIINLDRKDVPLEMTAEIIRKMDAEAHVMVTVHSAEQARFYLDRLPNIMFSAFVRTMEEFDDYDAEGIPWGQMIAYVGPRIEEQKQELYDKLHNKGVMIMIGSAPSHDHLETEAERLQAYQRLVKHGIDIIESDRPVKVARAISDLPSVKSSKQKYFNKWEL